MDQFAILLKRMHGLVYLCDYERVLFSLRLLFVAFSLCHHGRVARSLHASDTRQSLYFQKNVLLASTTSDRDTLGRYEN